MTDRAADHTDTTTELDKELVERISLTKTPSSDVPDEQTTKITPRDVAGPVDHQVPAPRADDGWSAEPPQGPYAGPASSPPPRYPPLQHPPVAYASQYPAARYPAAQYPTASYPSAPYPTAQYPAGQSSAGQNAAGQYPRASYGPNAPAGSWSAQAPPPPWPATNALPQAPGIPPLPAPRGRTNIPLIVFGVLAALVITGSAWALIMLAAGSSPFGSSVADKPQAAPSSSAAPAPPIAPVPPSSAPGGQGPSTGPTGEVKVSWSVGGVSYLAALSTTGSTGSATVAYTATGDPNDIQQVRQDLTLVNSGSTWAYQGSNPVDVDSGAPSTNYTPDIFVLTSDNENKVTINQVCDTGGTCAPAKME